MALAPRKLDSAEWLTSDSVKQVFAALGQGGEGETRAVGGCVRNTLLGEPVIDIDMATQLAPERVIALAEGAGIKAIPTGLAHGTVTLVCGKRHFEVTTLRADTMTDGRHAIVAFHGDWVEDAKRRDFTMNALYVSADGSLHDPLNGYDDLIARRVRFIGDPVERIREDYLRILRFFRFSAWYGADPLDAASLNACVQQKRGLEQLSRERVGMETVRLLLAPDPTAVLRLMDENGVTELVFGGSRVLDLDALQRLIRHEKAWGRVPEAILRLSIVARDFDPIDVQERLRLSNDDRKFLEALLVLERDQIPSRSALEQLVLENNTGLVFVAMLRNWILSGAPPDDPAWKERLDFVAEWIPPQFPITGADLLAAGVPKGPRIGQALKEAKTLWADSGYALNRDALIKRVL